MLKKESLDNLYCSYEYEIEESGNKNIRAYCIDIGMYKNIDLIPIGDNVSNDEIQTCKKDLEKSGFSCVVRNYNDIESAESQLYQGFFNIDKNRQRLINEYENYKKKIETVHSGNKYQYIYCDYFLNGESRNNKIIDDIYQQINDTDAHLILIEASAGFGKTCTAYESLIEIIKKSENKLPLLMELSRNRQAPIFKYILLSEIDRTFANSIKLDLVKKQIFNGNIILIIDGFDELLKTKIEESNDFEEIEPMLETIKELLVSKAKIILTSRKTAVMESEGFYDWVDNNDNGFKFSRFELKPPQLNNWLGTRKYELFLETGMPESSISNPVILTYLNNLSDDDFINILKTPDKIIEKYIHVLLDREKERQDLIIDVDEQLLIFEDISQYYAEKNISTEEIDTLNVVFWERNLDLLSQVIKRYPSESNLTADKLCGKLINHALLDRKENDYIGFVNDFIFGYFIGSGVINQKTINHDDILFDEIFCERAINSYKYENDIKKNQLWDKFNYLSNFFEINLLLKYDTYLKNTILHNINNEIVEKSTFESMNININCINTTFIYCKFDKCTFNFEIFSNVSFINCKFIDCLSNDKTGSEITFISCKYYNSNSIENYKENKEEVLCLDDIDYNKIVLERFWSIGRENYKPNKPVRTLYTGKTPKEHKKIEHAVNNLKKEEIIFIDKSNNIAYLNPDKLDKIKQILGR